MSVENVSASTPLEHQLTLLQAAKERQEKELADLQAQIDQLSEDFATRAAVMVRQGLQDSYRRARQQIGAIDLGFFVSIPKRASAKVKPAEEKALVICDEMFQSLKGHQPK